jgi:DNA-binding transcriptional MerR regulator
MCPSPTTDTPPRPLFVSTSEAARRAGCTPQKLWRLAAQGLLSTPAKISDRRRLWVLAEIEQLGVKRSSPPDPYVLSREAAAQILNVCPETISRWVRAGILATKRKNGGLFFRRNDLKAAWERQRNRERLNLEEAAALLGLKVWQLAELWRRGCFIVSDDRHRFRRGDVLAWLERYLRTRSLTGKPHHDLMFADLKPVLKR